MHGTIQILRLEHGFGLLRVPEGVEVFFHHGALPSPDHRPPLAVGRVVEFEVEPSPPSPCATAITIVLEPRRSRGPCRRPWPPQAPRPTYRRPHAAHH
jgi:cold shock CspA family protein